ncbi:MAG: hypothetical protein NT154_07450 [Verrucomicrobia bacterium]|nr:hypothetical protein [Verrucomicrobiota bacterium]
MNRTVLIGWVCVFGLGLAAGCRKHRTREFVAAEHPVKFENWRLYVNAFVDAANPSPTNHLYLISAVAWTAPGDSVGLDASQFRPTAYDASLDSLRLFRIEGTNAVELPLPPLVQGSADHPNRLVQLAPSSSAGIEIPASVRELRADIVMTFRHRKTCKTETKLLTTTMLKRERTRLEPILE